MASKREGPRRPAADMHAAERELARKLQRVGDDLALEEEASERRASRPETRYAKSGDLSIAYQVVGSGPRCGVRRRIGVPRRARLGGAPDGRCPPPVVRFGRLITFDKRGVGLSDRSTELPTLEQRMDDVRAVMDAADCERAAVVGLSEGGPMALLFAATYPERVSALVLWATFARIAWAPDYPDGVDVQAAEAFCDQIEESWGHGRVMPLIATQDAPDDEATRRRFARFERSCGHPGDGRGSQPVLPVHRRAPRSRRDLCADPGHPPHRRPYGQRRARPLPRRAHPRSPILRVPGGLPRECAGQRTRRSSTRSRSSSPEAARSARSTGYSRRSCSRTSWGRPNGP